MSTEKKTEEYVPGVANVMMACDDPSLTWDYSAMQGTLVVCTRSFIGLDRENKNLRDLEIEHFFNDDVDGWVDIEDLVSDACWEAEDLLRHHKSEIRIKAELLSYNITPDSTGEWLKQTATYNIWFTGYGGYIVSEVGDLSDPSVFPCLQEYDWDIQ